MLCFFTCFIDVHDLYYVVLERHLRHPLTSARMLF